MKVPQRFYYLSYKKDLKESSNMTLNFNGHKDDELDKTTTFM